MKTKIIILSALLLTAFSSFGLPGVGTDRNGVAFLLYNRVLYPLFTWSAANNPDFAAAVNLVSTNGVASTKYYFYNTTNTVGTITTNSPSPLVWNVGVGTNTSGISGGGGVVTNIWNFYNTTNAVGTVVTNVSGNIISVGIGTNASGYVTVLNYNSNWSTLTNGATAFSLSSYALSSSLSHVAQTNASIAVTGDVAISGNFKGNGSGITGFTLSQMPPPLNTTNISGILTPVATNVVVITALNMTNAVVNTNGTWYVYVGPTNTPTLAGSQTFYGLNIFSNTATTFENQNQGQTNVVITPNSISISSGTSGNPYWLNITNGTANNGPIIQFWKGGVLQFMLGGASSGLGFFGGNNAIVGWESAQPTPGLSYDTSLSRGAAGIVQFNQALELPQLTSANVNSLLGSIASLGSATVTNWTQFTWTNGLPYTAATNYASGGFIKYVGGTISSFP